MSRLDVNAVVSYNLQAIRRRRGLTQQAVADRLAELTGHRLPQAAISAMERGFDGRRRRRFDAHELHLLAVVFDVPIAYFLTPPPALTGAQAADTYRPVTDLCRALLGTDTQPVAVDGRLADIESSGAGDAGQNRFRTWRTHRLRTLERGYDDDRLLELAQAVTDLAGRLKARRRRPSPTSPTPRGGPSPVTGASPEHGGCEIRPGPEA